MRGSRLLAVVLGVVMGGLPVAPPEHVHEVEEEGHVHAVVHRHPPAHGFADAHADHPIDHRDADDRGHHPGHDAATLQRTVAILDHDDGAVLTPVAVYSVPAPFLVAGPMVTVVATIDTPEPRKLDRPSSDVDILIHGPPRAPTGLRAPPQIPTT